MAPETPKGVSSRLLSMKFMQRAAASASSTPGSDSEVPSSKKRKLGHDSGNDEFHIDQAAVQAAIDEREAKRLAALEKHAGNDTHWVLTTNWDKKPTRTAKQPLNVVYVGYGDLDPSDDDLDGSPKPGRTSTNRYKTKPSKPSTPGKQGKPDSEDNSTDEEEDSQDEAEAQSNTESPNLQRSRSRSQSNSKESLKAKEFRDKRKKKEVRLNNKITSISSAGAKQFSSPGSQNNSKMACYTCQQTGHKASDCPKKGSKGSSKRG